ncbi:MAG TPA: spore coat protein [Firmicutes bacterium]|mgnify:FL=1|jgi:spore coat protein CotF|nr:spore coat protein [Bacillota bacterium]
MQHELTDRDRLTDMLLLTKAVAGSYHSAAMEAATPRIRSSMIALHGEELKSAERLFTAMEERGWYRPEPAGPST